MDDQIKIFSAEIRDGLQEAIASKNSVAHCSPVSLNLRALEIGNKENINDLVKNEEIREKVLAENADQKDLFYLESVLVSTGWNKNDDVFRNEDMWKARSTPEDKQFNFQHDENDIIGHITGCYVEVDGEALEYNEASEDFTVPSDFNIVTQAVLYNSWTTAKNIDRMSKIIAEIEDGTWFVSMECLFSGFDYAVIDPTSGKSDLIERCENSAFLTKHLRAYGGSGEYEGFKIGRALKNIAFSGVGLVSQPANPKSVILNSKSVAFQTDENANFSSLLITGDSDMSDDFLKKQIDELSEAIVSAKAENEVLTQDNTSMKEAVASKEEAIAKSEEVVAELETKLSELQQQFDAQAEQLQAAKDEMDEMKKKEKEAKRMAQLAEAGISFEENDETIATFFSLDDASFDVILAKFAAEAKHYEEDKKKEEEAKMKQKADEEVTPEVEVQETEAKEVTEEAEADEAKADEVTAETFEGVESSEATLVESVEEDEAAKVRASVSEWLSNNVL